MTVAQCEINGLAFGFTANQDIIPPTELAQIAGEQRDLMMQYAQRIAPHMQYYAEMIETHENPNDVVIDIFGRGARWRESFVTEGIKTLITSPQSCQAKLTGKSAAIHNYVESQWACETMTKRDKSEVYGKPWGFVYLLYAATFGYCKIGHTTNPKNRLKDFGVKLPFKVECLRLITCIEPRKVESSLHEKHKAKRVDGEWFTLSIEDCLEIEQIPNYTEPWLYVLRVMQNEPTPPARQEGL